jgi:hypothetical protein
MTGGPGSLRRSGLQAALSPRLGGRGRSDTFPSLTPLWEGCSYTASPFASADRTLRVRSLQGVKMGVFGDEWLRAVQARALVGVWVGRVGTEAYKQAAAKADAAKAARRRALKKAGTACQERGGLRHFCPPPPFEIPLLEYKDPVLSLVDTPSCQS